VKLVVLVVLLVLALLLGAGAILSVWDIPPPAQPIERPVNAAPQS